MQTHSKFTFSVLCAGIKNRNHRIYNPEVVEAIMNQVASAPKPLYLMTAEDDFDIEHPPLTIGTVTNTKLDNSLMRNVLGQDEVFMKKAEMTYLSEVNDHLSENRLKFWRDRMHKYAEATQMSPLDYALLGKGILTIDVEIERKYLLDKKLFIGDTLEEVERLIKRDYTAPPVGYGATKNSIVQEAQMAYFLYGFSIILKADCSFHDTNGILLMENYERKSKKV